MEIKVQLNYLRMSPRKVRLAANLIKGLEARRAVWELSHLNKRAAEPLQKLLRSALASARNDFQVEDGSALYVKNIRVDEGSVLKRFRPRAFGRAAMIRKRSSHITLILDAKSAVPPRTGKGKPLVREATLEDVKRTDVSRGKEERMPAKTSGKTADFVRRMFRRKAI